MTNKKRYIIIILISILMNFSFYQLSRLLELPIWLDYVGTIFAAVTLEPAAGLLVGLVDNFYLAMFVSGPNAIIYYSISAVIALVAGVFIRRKGEIKVKRIIPGIFLLAGLSALISAPITVWRTGGFVPDDGWELGFFQMALGWGLPEFCCTFVAALIPKLIGGAAAAILVTIFYFILPKSLIVDRLPKKENK